MKNDLCNLLEKYKKNKKEVYLNKIINIFSPIVKKYSNKTSHNHREDFKQELNTEIFIVIKNIIENNKHFLEDKYLVNYIIKSIKRKYLHLLNEYTNIEITKNIEFIGDYYLNSDLYFYDLIKNLNHREQYILILHFKKCLKISDIANKLNYSRQHINAIKIEALSKLKNNIKL